MRSPVPQELVSIPLCSIQYESRCPICRSAISRRITLFLNGPQGSGWQQSEAATTLKENSRLKEQLAIEASKTSLLDQMVSQMAESRKKYELDMEFFKKKAQEALLELSEIKEVLKSNDASNRKEREKLLKDIQILKSSTAFSSSLIQKLKSELVELRRRSDRNASAATNENSNLYQNSSSLSPEMETFYLSESLCEPRVRKMPGSHPMTFTLSNHPSRSLNRSRLLASSSRAPSSSPSLIYDDRGALVKRIVDSAGNPLT
jgi:hypothetical protein